MLLSSLAARVGHFTRLSFSAARASCFTRFSSCFAWNLREDGPHDRPASGHCLRTDPPPDPSEETPPPLPDSRLSLTSGRAYTKSSGEKHLTIYMSHGSLLSPYLDSGKRSSDIVKYFSLSATPACVRGLGLSDKAGISPHAGEPRAYGAAHHKKPFEGHFKLILGAVTSFLEPFCGNLLPKVDKIDV